MALEPLLLLFWVPLLGTGGDELDLFFLAYFSKNGRAGRGEAVEGRLGELGTGPKVLLKLFKAGDPGWGESTGMGGGGLYPGLYAPAFKPDDAIE